MGYAIRLIFAIPLFILVVNFIFFRGNAPSSQEISTYIKNSKHDTIILPQNAIVTSQEYSREWSRGGQPLGFLKSYRYFDKKYNKYFSLTFFLRFDKNTTVRGFILGRNEDGDKISVRINRDQLHNPEYGTANNPVPVFPRDILNLRGGFTEDPFHVSDELNQIFVEQYLKYIMPKAEYKEMFTK